MKLYVSGNDKRQEEIKKLAENDGFEIVNDINKLGKNDLLILPAPVSGVKDLDKLRGVNCKIYGGAVGELDFIKEYLTKEAALYNAELTAEATIKLILERESIFNKNILILGFGKISKQLVKILSGFKANITCLVRRKEVLAELELMKIKADLFNNASFKNQDIIINTVPSLVVNRENIPLIGKNCFVIDLASLPGGCDFELLKKYNIDYLHALKLPAEHFPEAAGKIIYESIKEAENGF